MRRRVPAQSKSHPTISATVVRRRLLTAGICGAVTSLALAQPAVSEDSPEFEAIRRRGKLIVAVYKDNEPYSFGAAGDMTGLDVDIARELARAMDLGLSLLPFHAGDDMHADLRNMVTRGHYLGYGPADLMMRVPVDAHLMSANRMASIFGAYQRELPVVVIDRRRIRRLDSAHDLAGHALGAERGTGLTSALLAFSGGVFREHVRIFDTALLAVQAVLSGQIAAAYVTRAQAEYVIGRHGSATEAIGIDEIQLGNFLDRGWVVGMAVHSRNRALQRSAEDAMRQLYSSGQIRSIFRKYNMTLTPV